MKWFDNIIRRAWERATEPARPRAIHGEVSDVLNGRVCAMVYAIDNGFVLVNQNPTSGASRYVYAKDAVEVGEGISRQLTLQRMGVVQGASIRGAGVSMHTHTLTAGQPYAESQAKVAANPHGY